MQPTQPAMTLNARIGKFLGLAIAASGLALSASPAQALDTVQLKFGSLASMNMSLADLESFAKTGKATDNLQLLLDLGKLDKATAQANLTKELPIDSRLVTRLAQSYIGEVMFQQLGGVLKSPNATPWQEIRSAVLASVGDNKISPLELMRNYKPSTVEIDGQKAMEIAGRAMKDFEDLKGMLGGNPALKDSLCAPSAPSAAKPMMAPLAKPMTPAPMTPAPTPAPMAKPMTPAPLAPAAKPMAPAPVKATSVTPIRR
jgi:hypothetical protein